MEFSEIEHKIVNGTIISITEDKVIVNIGDDCDGIIPGEEFKYNSYTKEGEQIEVYVKGKDAEGNITLSYWEARSIRTWEKLTSAYNNNDTIERCYAHRIVRGGLRVNVLGEEAFMPYSEVGVTNKIDLKNYLKKKLDVKIIDINRRNRNIVVSHKKVIEECQDVLNNLEKGLILEGTVKNVTDFGAFVEIGAGITGLVYTKDISWLFVKRPCDFLKEGQKVKVVITDYNEDKTKISLSIKLAYPNPWDENNGYHIGDHITGFVVKITIYGAIIEVQPGIECLLHNSEISWYSNRVKTSNFFKVGDKVESVIIGLDRPNHKISLSVRQLTNDPWENIDNVFKVGDKVNISIDKVTDKALECTIDKRYIAVCLSKNITIKKTANPSKSYKKGDVCVAKITNINKDKRVIFVSIKAINEDEINNEYLSLKKYLEENKPIVGTIIGFDIFGSLELKITNNFRGVVGTKEICWQRKIDGRTVYKEGQSVQVLLKSINRSLKSVTASIKMLENPEWDRFTSNYSISDKLSGQVQDKLEDGSLHIRTYSGLYGVIKASDLYQEHTNPSKGQSVEAEIINIISATHTIYLSLRMIELEAVEEYSKQLQHAKDYNARILSINDDEIVIEVDGHKGFISRENATRSQDVSLHDIVHEGQTKKVWYLSCTDHKLQFLLKEVASKEYPKELFEKDVNESLLDLDIKTNEFIFEINGDKKAINLFQARYEDEDFKGEGKLLIDHFSGEQIHPSLEADDLEVGFYSGYLELRDIKERREKRNPYLFKLVDVTKLQGEEVNPYKYEDQLAFLQQADPSTNMSIASLLDEVGINLYKNKDRMFYELLQNADDASAQYGVQMRVQVTDNYVIISHNGYPFNADDFKSITSAAQSTKKNKKQNTGYKGIGFKSVFSNSSKVLIKSGGFFFMFDKNNEEFKDFDTFYKKRNEGVDWKKFIRKYTNAYVKFNSTPSIPWQLLPIWVDSMPEDLKGTRFDDGANVDIALKLDSNTAEYSEAISKIVNSPKFMLFLRHTRGIELSDGRVITKDKDGSHIFIQSTSIKGNTIESFIVVDDDKVEVNDDYFKRCGFDLFKKEMVLANGDREMSLWRRHEDGTEENLSGSIPNKIASSENTIISMAVPTDDNLVINPLTSDEENRIYAYLPLRERRFKFHFYLNADFILASDREQIQGDNLWNQFLFYNVGKRIVTWVKQVASKEQPNYLNLLQEELFPEEGADVEDIKPLAHQFNRGYKEALETEKFILGHDGEWHNQDEIIYDESGLSELITPELFCMIVGTDKKLPHPSIDSSFLNNKNLLPAIEHLSTTDVLKSILSKEVSILVKERCAYRNMPLEQRNKVEDWLKLKYNNYSEKVTTIVRYLPIFTFNGRLKSISECMNDSKNVILTDEVLPIKDIIEHSGLAISEENLSKSKLRNIIADKILPQLESDSFKRIVNVTSKSVDNELNSEEKVKLYTHYSDTDNKHKYGIKDSQLKGWTLFRNINGVHSTLAQLAHVEDGEDPIQFLSDYTIDDNEYKSMVGTAIDLSNGEPVYSLIIRNWDNITAKVTSEDDAIALYELVNKFFKKFNDTDGVFHKDNIRNLSTVYYSKEKKFISPDQILLFKDLSDDSPLRNVFEKLVALPIANEVIASTFSTTPFFNGFNDILKIDFNNNIDLTKEEISLIIESREGKERDLFSRYYIVPVGAGDFTLVKLRKDEYQYYSSNLNIKNMMAPIKNYHILPDDFKELADTSNNIVTGESLVKIIFDYYKDFTLNQVVADISNDDDYVELEKLSQIEDFDISKIRNKFYLKSADVSCSLNEIHLQKDISVAGHTFTKVDLVPGQDKTTNLATKIRTKLEGRDFKKAWLDKLFGVEQSSQDAAKEMFDKLNKSNYVLDNGKQLAFMLMYAKANGVNVVAKVEALSVNNPTTILAGNTLIGEDVDFISKDNILSEKYKEAFDSSLLGSCSFYNNSVEVGIGRNTTTYRDILLLYSPYVYNSNFQPIAFDLNSKEKVHSLLSYIQNLDIKDSIQNREKIASSLSIKSHDMTLSKYCLDDEKLPDSVLSWINENNSGIRKSFIHNFFHVEDETSITSKIRAYLSGDITDLAENIDFKSSGLLEKTCKWIINKKVVLNDEQYDKLHELLKTKIVDEIDIQTLRSILPEVVKYTNVGKFSVYLYSHEMPHNVLIANQIIYRYYQDKAYVDGNNIYLDAHSKNKLLDVLCELTSANSGFTSQDFVEYIHNNKNINNRSEENSSQRGYLDVGNDYGLSEDEQIDYQKEAQKVLLPKLRDELGLDISHAICEYSIISGITKNNLPVPVVIKSYLHHDSPLRINPNEWIQLMKKNSILAVRYGRKDYGWYKIHDLLKSKDEIVLSFSSENLDKEDRIDKFAELLRYFNNVHFNFKDLDEPRSFNMDDPFGCSFNNEPNDASRANLKGGKTSDID